MWEELGAEGISIDDIPFLFGPSTSSSSSVQTAKTGLMLVCGLTAFLCYLTVCDCMIIVYVHWYVFCLCMFVYVAA